MATYLEMPLLDVQFPLRTLQNEGDILTTPHWHNETEIIYVKQGIIHMGIGEESIMVKEGEFVLIASGMVHYVLASPGSLRCVLQFRENFFYDLLNDSEKLYEMRNLWKEYPAHSSEWKTETADVATRFLTMVFAEDQAKMDGYMFAIKGYLYLFIMEMYRNKEYHSGKQRCDYTAETSSVLERLDAVFCFVEEHYKEKISLERAAKSAGFSTFYFARFFKKYAGKTFIQFLNEYRIDKAKWILMNEDVKAADVVERTGLGSEKTYYRLFKESVGMSPSEYQKKMSNI